MYDAKKFCGQNEIWTRAGVAREIWTLWTRAREIWTAKPPRVATQT